VACRIRQHASVGRQSRYSPRRETPTSDRSTTSSGLIGSAEQLASSGLRSLVGRERELARLEKLLGTVRGGGSAALVLHGEPGVGKSALLDQLTASAAGFEVVRATGVEGEVDLPYAGLHQLCRSMIDTIGVLPQPQSDALRVAFGHSSGETPDRYIVGLAILGLMSEVAAAQPVLCVVDDAQWLDPETTRALAFVARRLGADSVGLVFATREIGQDLEGVPELRVGGLSASESRVLLDSVLVGHLDGPVRERFLAETHGNPLALIELPRALTPAEAATGIVRQSRDSLTARIEEGFRRQLEPLPADTRRLLVLAAAEPLGDPLLLLHAASTLGLGVESADPADVAGLFQVRERCAFRHPLVRSAAYGAATPSERRMAHAALAEATDPDLHPDRRAWHRAQSTPTPDEDVAADLERTAARAKARGGLAAAGAFLERAAVLTPDAGRRAERTLAAAEMMYEAGAFEAVENLLRALEGVRLDELQAARAERLGARVSLSVGGHEKDALLRLVTAADGLERLDPELANATLLEAVWTAIYFPSPDVLGALADALNRSPASDSGAIIERILRGYAEILAHGYPSGTELLREAMFALRDKPQLEESDLPLLVVMDGTAKALWDFDSWESMARRMIQAARDVGALSILPRALGWWCDVNTAAGAFPAAEAALAEAETVAEVTRATFDRESGWLDALRFDAAEALRRIDLQERSAVMSAPFMFDYERALVYIAAGQYEAALDSAQRSCDGHPQGTFSWGLVELVEAAARCGHRERAATALEQLAARTRLASTNWALGLEARSAALLEEDPALAETLHREAIDRLGRARTRPDLARAHLVFGERLRRDSRRIDARDQLRTAHELFSEIGMPGFLERARRELAATGETARTRTDETRSLLTPQEAQIARLARDGLSNPEIGAQLFISPRTVQYHLRKVFQKLDITSRNQLGRLSSGRLSSA
jgi:DNA-binding CsgD family transcriptional regulator